MRTPRQASIDRALLAALGNVPDTYLMPQGALCADVARAVHPRAAMSEVEEAIRYADTQQRIAGIAGEEDMLWQITPAGRLWRARNG